MKGVNGFTMEAQIGIASRPKKETNVLKLGDNDILISLTGSRLKR